MEVFVTISGFLGTYKVCQIQEAKGGSLSFKDVMKIYARKLLRVLPLYYFLLFFGWFAGPRLSSGPIWFTFESLYFECESRWWAHLLFIGNFIPFMPPNNEGCMYWSWAITTDF